MATENNAPNAPDAPRALDAPPAGLAPLTPKQALFVREYLVDANATAAAVRAGYSARAAAVTGCRNLKKPEIAAALRAAMDARAERTRITADRVLEQYARLAFFDIRTLYRADGALKPVHEWSDEAAAAVAAVETAEALEKSGPDKGALSGYVRKVKLADRRAALADLGKHLGLFTDQAGGAGKEDLADAIDKARKRAGAAGESGAG